MRNLFYDIIVTYLLLYTCCSRVDKNTMHSTERALVTRAVQTLG